MRIQASIALSAAIALTATVAANGQVPRPSATKMPAKEARGKDQGGVSKATASTAPGGVCLLLSNAIDASEKELSKIDSEDIGDNSAPRASVRASKKVYAATMISNNLDLMREYHCSPYPHAISDATYMLPAMSCRTAMLKLETRLVGDANAKVELPDECDETKWTRVGEH